MSYHDISRWISPIAMCIIVAALLYGTYQSLPYIRRFFVYWATYISEKISHFYCSMYEACFAIKDYPWGNRALRKLHIKHARENWLQAARNKNEFLRRPDVSTDHPTYVSYIHEEYAELTHYIVLKGSSTQEEKAQLRLLRDMVMKKSDY